jgi:hypothetical protein
MLSMTSQRSIRLNTTTPASLATATAQPGEVFYDSGNKTLRVFDGRTKGGFQLLRADLANVSGSVGVNVGVTPPTNPQQGTQWINALNGVLYVYYVDVNGGHWVQPITSPVGVVPAAYVLPTATTSTLGGVLVDGTSVVVNGSGVISAVQTSSFVNSNFIGNTIVYHASNILNTIVGATGVVTHDISTAGNTFYHTGVVNNFTANFTNVPTTNNRNRTVSLIIAQGNPAWIPSVVQIEGVTQTLNWANGLVPTGNVGNYDIVSFNLIRTNNTWTVVGQLAKNGLVDANSPTYTFSSVPTSINEGASGTYIVTTTNVSNGTTLYWTVNYSTALNADFVASSGTFTINNNTGQFTVSPVADVTTEGPETFTVSVKIGSISGTVVASTNIQTINDTSV